MRFSLRRRVEQYSDDDIDRQIEAKQQEAKELVHELDDVIEQQSHLYQEFEFKEHQHGDHSSSEE